MVDRTRAVTVRLSVDELAMLQALAEKVGLSGSDVVRTQIREAYAAAFGDKKPRIKK